MVAVRRYGFAVLSIGHGTTPSQVDDRRTGLKLLILFIGNSQGVACAADTPGRGRAARRGLGGTRGCRRVSSPVSGYSFRVDVASDPTRVRTLRPPRASGARRRAPYAADGNVSIRCVRTKLRHSMAQTAVFRGRARAVPCRMAAGETAAWRCRHEDSRCARYGGHALDGATSGFRGGARQRGSDRPAVPTPGPAPPGSWRTPTWRSKWRIPGPTRTSSASIRALWNAERKPGRPPTAGGTGPHLPVAPQGSLYP